MSLSGNLLETIKVKDRQLQNIHWHNIRFNHSRRKLFGIKEELKLETFIKIPPDLTNAIYKCRLTYSLEIEKTEFEKYTPRIIQSLKVVEADDLDYSFKYADRTKLQNLFDLSGNCDDILIIKNGLLTDTSYANIVFWDGEKWITSSSPLLKGTARERLLSEGKISEAKITIEDLKIFKKARIINAMNDLTESPDIHKFCF
jgi:4-amino-4-deoxychorismate lyase